LPHQNRMIAVRRWARVTWTLLSAFGVESIVFGLAVLPAALFWQWHLTWPISSEWARITVLAMVFVPAYLLFAATLMLFSAAATGLLGWRTPADAEMRIRDLEWPLLDWVRYTALTHVSRVFAGTFFRATPLWTMYLRLNGARVGRGVYVNTLGVSDHNLLEFGSGTVIGSDVHIAGHTVERGFVKTRAVRVGRNVTIGVGSVVMMGAEIGDGCDVGALSFVPKGVHLDGGVSYAGIPVHPLVSYQVNLLDTR
jgi:acetyltransferase-like isoleucine patch superfamily enzyme